MQPKYLRQFAVLSRRGCVIFCNIMC